MIINALNYILMPQKEKLDYRAGIVKANIKRLVKERKEGKIGKELIDKHVMQGEWKNL